MPSSVPASRCNAWRMTAPSVVRVSPAIGAGPRAAAPSASTPSPSMVAMSARRSVDPCTVACAATVTRARGAPPAAAAPNASSTASLLNDRIRRPEHLVRGLDRLRRHFVGALARDQRDQLLDHAHVGVLEVPLQNRSAVLLPGRA